MCSFTETLTAQDGDFADPSYAWTGYTLTPQTVTIGDNTTATIGLTNNYTRQSRAPCASSRTSSAPVTPVAPIGAFHRRLRLR